MKVDIQKGIMIFFLESYLPCSCLAKVSFTMKRTVFFSIVLQQKISAAMIIPNLFTGWFSEHNNEDDSCSYSWRTILESV